MNKESQVFASDALARALPLTPSQLRSAFRVAAHLLSLGITAYVFLVLNKRFYYAEIGYDEEFFAWGGWCINKGLVPYRDFLEFKPPMVFLTHALAIFLFGFKNGGYRIFFAIYPLLSVLTLQSALIARRVNRFLAMSVMLGVVSLWVNPTYHDTALTDCESIGLANYMFGLALFLWEGRYLKVTTILGGIFMCCCVFSKEPFGPVVAFTWLGMFWLRERPGDRREIAKFFAQYSLLGVAIFFVIMCIYMVPTGSMKAYITMARGYSRIYRDPQTSYCVALGLARPLPPWEQAKVAWDKIRVSYLNENILGYLVPLVIPGAIFAYRRSAALFGVMVLAFLGALWAPTATNCQWTHYYNMSMAGVIFVLVAGFDSMKRPLNLAEPAVRAAVAFAAFLVVGLHMYEAVARERKTIYQRQTWHEPQPGLLAFIEQNTVPTDRIFTSGPPVLYPQADRISAVRETNIIDEILPSYDGTTDEERLRPVYDQLVRNQPKVVFLDPEHGWRKNRHNQSLILPYLKEFNYQKINENLYLRP
jgi:hypothetical protein